MGELQPLPKPSEHGRFLRQESVEGTRVPFVNQSTNAVSLITLNATGDASNFDFGSFTVSFSYQENGNIFPWESVLAWNYANFYIDDAGAGGPNDSYLWRIGSAVAGATAPLRKPMLIDIQTTKMYNPLTFNFPYSHTDIYYMKNNDSSSHTVRLVTLSKYIVTGEMV